MISVRKYIKLPTHKECEMLNKIAKTSKCNVRFNSSKDIVNVANLSSLLEMESGFYYIFIEGKDEREIFEKIKEIIK